MVYIFLFILGAVLGSFLNVCIYRLPRGQSLVYPASHCPDCKSQLLFFDLIPLLSYLFLRGRCRFCQKGISRVYPLVEFISALILVLLYARFGFGFSFFLFSVCFLIFEVIFFIDLEHLAIPEVLIGAGLALVFILRTFHGEFFSALQGGVLGFAIMAFILKAADFIYRKETMGWGDVELAAFLGVLLGPVRLGLALFLTYLLAAPVSLILIGLKYKTRRDVIPLGPFMIAAAVISSLWGAEVISWYVKIIR